MTEETTAVPMGQATVSQALLEGAREARKKLLKAETELSRAKAEAKAAQEEYNSLTTELIAEPRDGFPHGTPMGIVSMDGEDQSWREVPLDTLTIADKTIDKLAENNPPIQTIGDLSDWIAAKGEFWAKDTPGIGKAANEAISDALMAFWADRSADMIADKV